MKPLTIFGGRGFVGSAYTRAYYDQAIGNIASINQREDHEVYSEDILYLISTVHNYHVFDDPYLDIETNLETLVRVLENWESYQGRTGKKGVFNFISSWSVYGNQETLPVPETAPCFPKGFYIATKFCAENLVEAFCTAHKFDYRILRLANVVGPGDKPSVKKNQLQFNINKLAKNEDVTLFGDGNFFRDFMHVDDVARAIETVMCRGNLNEIYNIGNGRAWLYGEILKYAKHALDSSGNIVYMEPTEFQKKVPVASFYMDVTKLHALGFHSEYTYSVLYDSLLKGK